MYQKGRKNISSGIRICDLTDNKSKNYKYLGNIHIHTTHSDGSGNICAISKAAKKAGLSWIIITDHNYIDFEEGIYNDIYVLKGEEISPKHKNHYLAFDIKNKIEAHENPQIYIDETRIQGGFGFCAHPDESLDRKNQYPPIRWDKNFIPDGIEIWNWFSSWVDNLNNKNIFSLAHSFLFKNSLVIKANEETIFWWDELNSKNEKIIPAICGSDCHAMKIKKYIIPLTIFPYKTLFKKLNNAIELNEPLSKEFSVAKKQILNAIKNGNNLIVNRAVLNDIPKINITNSDKSAFLGEAIKLDKKTYLNVELTKKAIIKVILDGRNCFSVEKMKEYPLIYDSIGRDKVVQGRVEL